MKKSALLRLALWFNKWPGRHNFIGWVWALNSILFLMAILLADGSYGSAILCGFCFLIAAVNWNRSDDNKGIG